MSFRSGIRSGYQSRCVRIWQEMGVEVKVTSHNVKVMEDTEKLISMAKQMAPVGGIFHLAMVDIFETMRIMNYGMN